MKHNIWHRKYQTYLFQFPIDEVYISLSIHRRYHALFYRYLWHIGFKDDNGYAPMIVNLITPSSFLQMSLLSYTYYRVLKRWTTRWDLMWSRICLPFRINWEHPVLLGFVMLNLYFSVVFSVLLFVYLSFFI